MTSPQLPLASTPIEADSASEIAPVVLREIARQLHGLRFGSVEIVVHEGHVTQIERREKVRFPPSLRSHGS